MLIQTVCVGCGSEIAMDHEDRSIVCPHCGITTSPFQAKYEAVKNRSQPTKKKNRNTLWILLAIVAGFVLLGVAGNLLGADRLMHLLFFTGLVCGYFIPSALGWKKRNRTAILLLNIFLGWTLIGWVVALVWAATKERP